MKWFVFGLVAVAMMACGDDDSGARRDAAAEDDAGEQDAEANDSGSTDSGTDSAVASCGALMGRTTECHTCLQTACCTELSACGGDAACVGLVTCLRGCDDPDASTDCTSTCVAAHGVSVAYNPLLLCGADDCMDECPFGSP